MLNESLPLSYFASSLHFYSPKYMIACGLAHDSMTGETQSLCFGQTQMSKKKKRYVSDFNFGAVLPLLPVDDIFVSHTGRG